MNNFMLGAAIGIAIPAGALSQTTADPNRLLAVDRNERLFTHWAYLARYGADNARLVPTPGHRRIVFLGDSITEGWVSLSGDFFTPGRIGRGVSGQTTPQMVARFRADVIDLHPAVVQIMAGTNDIAGNTGPMTPSQTQGNIKSMVDMAQAHGIRVILASIPPSSGFPWKPGLEVADKIVAMNAWLKAYAARSGCVYADYWSALKGDGTGMRAGLSSDGVHPVKAGYAVMAPVAEAAIRQALAMRAPHKTAVE